MLNRKLIARSVAAVLAVGGPILATSAQADLQFDVWTSRVLDCAQASAVGQPACVGAGPNRYQVDLRFWLRNPPDPEPGPGTTPPDPVPVPVATPVSITVENLTAAFGQLNGVPNWTPVGAPVASNISLTVPTTFTGLSPNNKIAEAADFTKGSEAYVTMRVETTLTAPVMTPGVVASAGTGLSASTTIQVPPKRDTKVPDATTGCPVGTTRGAKDYVVNGSFTTLPADGATAPAGTLIAGSFTSDVPLVAVGFNEYQTNKSISLLRGSVAALDAQQQSLPGGASVNWLRHGGGKEDVKDDVPHTFWKQTVTGLEVGRDYLLSAYFSNISVPGEVDAKVGRNDPKIRFLAGGNPVGNAPDSFPAESAAEGDIWNMARGVFKATATTMDIAIQNQEIGGWYNQVGVTDIKMLSCLKPGQAETSPAPTTPTTPPTPTTPATPSSPGDPVPVADTTPTASGGGGGAVGFGGLALLLVPVAIRRGRRTANAG